MVFEIVAVAIVALSTVDHIWMSRKVKSAQSAQTVAETAAELAKNAALGAQSAEATAKAAIAHVATVASTIETEVRAKVSSDVNDVLNALRADSSLATERAYATIARVKQEVLKVI